MIYLYAVLPLVSILIGLYCITIALWELRAGAYRQRYTALMFTGLALVFVLPALLGTGLAF